MRRACLGPEVLCVTVSALAACGRRESPHTLHVAVAANLSAAFTELSAAFAREHQDVVVEPSYGATGALCAQIEHGAPFAVLLAADQERPRSLEQRGLAVAGTRFAYARGRLALVGPRLAAAADGAAALRAPDLGCVAIANPSTAPYGVAAQQVLEHLGLTQVLAGKLLLGQSVAQAQAFVDAGGADLGFVALAQVVDKTQPHWQVPESLHAPIWQDAVLVRESVLGRAFLAFLRGAQARAILVRHGYGVEG